MAIYFRNRQKALRIDPRTLKRRASKLLAELGLADHDLSVLATDDAEISRINKDYRGRDQATNVLSFSMLEGEPMPGAPKVLGDLVISAETTGREAGPLGYSDGEMFYFYLIHGLLHLAGHDHELGEKEAARQESETLRLFNLLFARRLKMP